FGLATRFRKWLLSPCNYFHTLGNYFFVVHVSSSSTSVRRQLLASDPIGATMNERPGVFVLEITICPRARESWRASIHKDGHASAPYLSCACQLGRFTTTTDIAAFAS